MWNGRVLAWRISWYRLPLAYIVRLVEKAPDFDSDNHIRMGIALFKIKWRSHLSKVFQMGRYRIRIREDFRWELLICLHQIRIWVNNNYCIGVLIYWCVPSSSTTPLPFLPKAPSGMSCCNYESRLISWAPLKMSRAGNAVLLHGCFSSLAVKIVTWDAEDAETEPARSFLHTVAR